MAVLNYTHDAASKAAVVNGKALSSQVEAVGRELARYGLVVVIAWIGLMKFTAYEAEGISRSSPTAPS